MRLAEGLIGSRVVVWRPSLYTASHAFFLSSDDVGFDGGGGFFVPEENSQNEFQGLGSDVSSSERSRTANNIGNSCQASGGNGQAKKEKKVMKKRVPKIYFGTRTHKQIEQIIRELNKTAYRDTKISISTTSPSMISASSLILTPLIQQIKTS